MWEKFKVLLAREYPYRITFDIVMEIMAFEN